LATAAIVIIVAIAKTIDLKHKREEEAVLLQTQISDVLMRDRTLARFPVTPTVHIPIWWRAPATIEMHGQVPTGEFRQAVLHVATQESARVLAAFSVQDRMAVVPSAGTRAA
jgi:hypothetical protein